MIYLEDKTGYRMPRGTVTIDRVPPKSTYMDRNRSNIVISKTFVSPSEEIMDELYASVEKRLRELWAK